MRWSFLRSALKAWALAVTSGLLPGQAEPESAPDVFARLAAGEPKEGSVVESGGYCFIRVVRRGARGRNVPDSMLALQGVQSIVRNAALQAASRTMMVFHTTPDRATEAFGLYALSGKATTYLGTMGIALFTLISGSQRLGIAIPLIALFVLGMVFLAWVKPMGERS